MITIGGHQLLKMEFPRLKVSPEWYGILGRLPEFFYGVVYGGSGEGKTELCVQLAVELSRFGKVDWISYEQGFGPDLQDAAQRNNVVNYPISFSNPWKESKRKRNKLACLAYPKSRNENINQLFEDLVFKMSQKKGARFYFIDSVDSSRFTKEMCEYLRTKFPKKGIIFIAHGKRGEPKGAVAQEIEFMGSIGIYVENFIAYPLKSRWGAVTPKVINEERARLRNPLFFETQDKELLAAKKVEEKEKRKKKAAAKKTKEQPINIEQ